MNREHGQSLLQAGCVPPYRQLRPQEARFLLPGRKQNQLETWPQEPAREFRSDLVGKGLVKEIAAKRILLLMI